LLAYPACGGTSDDPAGPQGSGGSAPAIGFHDSAATDAASSDAVDGSAVAMSGLARDPAPVVAEANRRALASDNAAFCFDLYGRVRAEQKGNFLFSPFSTSIALAMTYAGARGETESQMASALHFTLPQDKLHPAFNQVDLALLERNQAADPANGKGFKLRLASSIWGQRDFPFHASFLDTLAVNYGAGLRLTDFVADHEAARGEINAWVSQSTDQKVTNLIPEGLIDTATRLVLANAVYFNASWKEPFQDAYTANAPFDLLDGTQVSVKMMHDWGDLPYTSGDGYQIVQLPYEGDLVVMTIVVPDEGRFSEVEAKLSGPWVAGALAKLYPRRVHVGLPKFGFSTALGLRSQLEALGMTDAFKKWTANFAGMSGAAGLYIRDVVHQAFIGIDEKGTEAAAATAVVVAGDATAPPPPKEVLLNRPFVFLVRDLPTQAILFAGRVVDPTG
jgi:serpin B